jgi:hypothetical protein
MTEDPTEPFQGWTLFQALERTANPQTWDEWLAAKAEYERVRAVIPSAPGSFIVRSPDQVRGARRVVDEVFSRLTLALREFLIDGSLNAVGSRSVRSNPPMPINRDGWRALTITNHEKSIVAERSAPTNRIYNVRVFPLAHAEDAAARLSGQSLAAIFRKCVLQDPEVVACSKRIPDRKRHEDVFEKGQAPGPYVTFEWSCDMTPSDLAFDFVRPVVFFTSQELPRASAQIQRVSEVIVDRWQRLRRRLIDGDLVARGTHERTGIVRYVEPLQWVRKDLSIDVVNSDLLQMKDNKPVVQWTGLMLVRPSHNPFAQRADIEAEISDVDASMFHGKPTGSHGLPRSTAQPHASADTPTSEQRSEAKKRTPRISAQQRSIEEAIADMWPAGMPSLLAKERDERIRDWQRRKGAIVASPKTISRYLARR